MSSIRCLTPPARFCPRERRRVKGRGNFTWTLDKKPYSLKLETKASLLGMSSHKRYVLLANHLDKSLLRTEAAFRMGEMFDGMDWTPAPNRSPCIWTTSTWAFTSWSRRSR
ncbi:MAG: CotH kinase family protein [Acidobacteriota bacterium]|nr:CotH kinase family protein [Acidobacteriota bacterium]